MKVNIVEKKFGEIIKSSRRKRSPRITQKQMAESIGMSHSNYRKTECGLVRLRFADAIKMCRVLGIMEIKVEA